MKRMNFPRRKELRREQAEQRIADRIKRTPQEQLDRLDKLLGVNVGATKERIRLQALVLNRK